MTKWIAERRLLYTPKGCTERRELVIRIGQPYLLKESRADFAFDESASGCLVEFYGLDIAYSDEVCGADSLQAVQIASNVEPALKRLSKKYDLYFEDGEPYFDSSEEEY